MKRTLLTLAVTSLLATTAFAGPIRDAAARGDLAGVQAELDKGVDVNAKDEQGENEFGQRGQTPLHGAAYWGSKEIVQLLIAKGVDVNAKTYDGETPLDLAKGETADLLRKHGGKTGDELK